MDKIRVQISLIPEPKIEQVNGVKQATIDLTKLGFDPIGLTVKNKQWTDNGQAFNLLMNVISNYASDLDLETVRQRALDAIKAKVLVKNFVLSTPDDSEKSLGQLVYATGVIIGLSLSAMYLKRE